MKIHAPVLCLFLALCGVVSHAQVRKASPTPMPSEEPPLSPLTEAERALDLRGVVANQPDFTAEEEFFYGEGFGGFSARRRVARKGERYLIDTGFVRLITEPGKEIRLDDATKTYDEEPTGERLVLGSGAPIDPRELASQQGVSFVALGAQPLDGHRYLKIEAKLPGQRPQVFLYADEDLKYLIVAAQVLDPPRGSVQRLRNISLEVPAHLVEIPPGYKPLPKHKWTRVESANVIYFGRPQKDYNVFRSEEGDQLFVTLYEPHPASGLPLPWHYLVYLRERTVEIAFQGTLVTSGGRLAWQTDEKEAVSSGDQKPEKDHYPCDWRKCPKTVVGANFADFPSVYYDDRKSVVRVTW